MSFKEIKITYIDNDGKEYYIENLPKTKDILQIALDNLDELKIPQNIKEFQDKFVFIGNDHLFVIGEKLFKIDKKIGKMYIKQFVKQLLRDEKEYYGKNYSKMRMQGKYKKIFGDVIHYSYTLYDMFGFDICEYLTKFGIFAFVFPNKRIKKRKIKKIGKKSLRNG